ncbi:MAG: ABC transporter ATP-binding protein [Mesorhizobium sp.]|uniref:ABC transporter ATP-binding protein n=1 Tax=unclassified Mesorhizobium TaxID=325217 RepID=UPI000F74FDC2|nr:MULTISPECIES: ABC transporter ATP-binding protein [unclassified Mesorhizobium]AZO70862.1 ABC transporter ATP-binding protein [Mesorhizobium sp. M1D.F.Ca.ET.043.01.1.1]RWA82342.1 MAG: ATP-binding cassette domain-containing protein [Mesorhizobium sp.]RWD60506.1 MAG: ATP-binding cassette domain-containing protein [Mesorhizobium sp.]RWE09805.1 MAG: ATP-binding cassette domain-containing protein [Mesorhizobium sp.]RWE50409.1 MAG: ATP-binding cassette domain-containing protein [Mesorhizobium sp.]
MAKIRLERASVSFPVYNAASRSLKNRVLTVATGGAIERRFDGLVVVKGLDEIDLAIHEGERVGLVGHNGSGKTTLLRLLSGIYAPTSGTAAIDGECVSLINIGLGIDPEATGRENIRLRAVMMGMTAKELSAKYEEIAEFSGLGDFLDMPFRTYSSGMQLRLAFATSTSIRPEILIMDEWLSTGDEDFKDRARQRLNEIVSSTKILILASHSKELLLGNCDRLIWLEHGRVRMDGPAKAIADEYFGR